MISAAEIAGTTASKVVTPANVKKLKGYLAKEFGITPEDNWEGLYLAAAALYGSGIPQAVYDALKLLFYIEKQVSAYLQTLGADLNAVDGLRHSVPSLTPQAGQKKGVWLL